MITITITSSGTHYGPLKPASKLRYDLQEVENPPRHIRQNMDGRSKKLRDHLMQDDKFVALLDKVKDDVLQEIKEEQDKLPKDTAVGDTTTTESPIPAQQEDLVDSEPEEDYSASVGLENKEIWNSNRIQGKEGHILEEESSLQGPEITVNCFCYLGRHRSASMVEELARLKWPKNVSVNVVHRDIDKDRRKAGKTQKTRKTSKMFQNQEEEL